MLKIGVAQTRNSTDIQTNYSSIYSFLNQFEKHGVDMILFPECSLSGFSAKIKDCTLDVLTPFLNSIDRWCTSTGIQVVLPTAIAEKGKVFNAGYWFTGKDVQRFQKLGLTESEQKFFSVSENLFNKVFEIKGYRCALLICMEAQQPWNTYFKTGEADIILWPGYWGWKQEDDWSAVSKDGSSNLIFENMKSWKIPLIQSNFAYNDLTDYRKTGPEGLSVVVDAENKLFYRAFQSKESGFVVSVVQKSMGVYTLECLTI